MRTLAILLGDSGLFRCVVTVLWHAHEHNLNGFPSCSGTPSGLGVAVRISAVVVDASAALLLLSRFTLNKHRPESPGCGCCSDVYHVAVFVHVRDPLLERDGDAPLNRGDI